MRFQQIRRSFKGECTEAKGNWENLVETISKEAMGHATESEKGCDAFEGLGLGLSR